MKHPAGIKKTQGVRIIFDNAPEFDEENIISFDFIDWQPLYNLYINTDGLVISIEIAGVDIQNFSIYLKRDYLIIMGNRRFSDSFSRERCVFHNLEIPYGRFRRRIDFPVPVDVRCYQYTIENGILNLKFPLLKERVIPIEEG